MTRNKPWTDDELTTVIQVYLDMLCEEAQGRKFNKSAYRRSWLDQNDHSRSAGSYEMKCCNISAALKDQGRQWIAGYKPLPGYQRKIRDVLDQQLAARPFLLHLISEQR